MPGWEKKELGDTGRSWCNSDRPPRMAAVFVHGFQGDDLDTWTYTSKSWLGLGSSERVELFDLLKADQELDKALACDYYSLSHRAGITSGSTIDDTAQVLKSFIETNVRPRDLPVVLIAHSFGGLASRRAILYMLEQSRENFRIAGLMMFGTPNSGSDLARVADYLGSGSGGDSAPFNEALGKLNREWTENILGGNPDLSPEHRVPLLCRFVVGTEDKIVPRVSAGSLASFADLKYLPYGHLRLVKPRNRDDPSYRMMADFLSEAKEAYAHRTGEWAARFLTYRLRHATLAGRWVREETEEIVLGPTGDENWLSCHVRNVRRGGLTENSFNLCAYLSGQRPDVDDIDFSWELGRGNLSEQEFGALAGRFRDESTRLFEIGQLSVSQGGVKVDYVAKEPQVGHGWALFRYETTHPIVEDRPYDELVLDFTTRVNRTQGWYHYVLGRTVSERLEVVFVAPFEACHINTLVNGADFRPPLRSGDAYIHRVTVDKPLPLGRSVTWVYPRNSR